MGLYCFANAQILRIATTPSAINSQIPGSAEVSVINTRTFSYTPSVPSVQPTPIDEDATTEDDRIFDFGDLLSVNVSNADGNITSTSVGMIWSLKISIPNALNIGLVFSQFNLAASAEMYIFNDDKTVLDSAIKLADFTNASQVNISSIQGHAINIFIVEKNNFGAFQSVIVISKLVAGFQDIEEVGTVNTSNERRTINCDPMIMCYLDKLPFARAVARMITPISTTRAGFCTGTLINNETNNGRAYFLTAFHCLDFNRNGVIDISESSLLPSTVFQFRFWRTACNGSVINVFIEFSGATLLASSKNSDVLLLELTNPPGIGDLVNYAGWDRGTGAPSTGSFIIHHPQTEDMRIAITSRVNSWTWNNNYWSAHYVQGTMDKGSSGSALMNPAGLIIGQLKGGWSNCNYTNFGDRFGKLSSSWGDAGLQIWLSRVQNLTVVPLLDLTNIPVNGPSTVGCTIQGIFSTYPNLLDVTYHWDVTSGIQINSGQGTSTVNISSTSPTVTGGTLTLTLTSPTKGRTRIYQVSKFISFTTPLISLTSTQGQCTGGGFQSWNIVNNNPNYGTNWHWTVGSLNPNSQIIINNPNSPSTSLSVKGGGSVRLTYRDLCGGTQITGVTVYSSCGFSLVIADNPVQNDLNIFLGDNNNDGQVATSNSIPQTSSIESTGKTIFSLYEINTNSRVKQWRFNETTNQSYRLSTVGLRKGAYVLQADRDNQTRVSKVIIQ